MTETKARPVGAVTRTCALCGREARTKVFRAAGGEYSLCRDCHPDASKGERAAGTRTARKRALYSDAVLDILYRFGGATPRQLARLLVLSVPEIRERGREALRREIRGERSEASPMPSYSIASQALASLRRDGETEVTLLHRAWESNAGRGSKTGRTEHFHRFSKGVAGREAVVEAANVAGGKEDSEEANYRLHWSGGSKEDGAYRHSAHRTDWIVQLVSSLAVDELNLHGASIDLAGMWGEGHPSFPLIGAKIEKKNAAGEKKYDSSRQKKTKYVAHREFERVVPDFVMEVEFGGAAPGGGGDGGGAGIHYAAPEEVYS